MRHTTVFLFLILMFCNLVSFNANALGDFYTQPIQIVFPSIQNQDKTLHDKTSADALMITISATSGSIGRNEKLIWNKEEILLVDGHLQNLANGSEVTVTKVDGLVKVHIKWKSASIGDYKKWLSALQFDIGAKTRSERRGKYWEEREITAAFLNTEGKWIPSTKN